MSGKAKTVENQQMEVSKSTGAVMTAFFHSHFCFPFSWYW